MSIIGKYFKPIVTRPRNFITKGKSNISKNKEWLQIAECPCIIDSIKNEYVILHSFSSAIGRKFKLSLKEFSDEFTECPVVEDHITNLQAYPGSKIHLKEFEKRKKIKGYKSDCKKISKNKHISENLRELFDKKVGQLFVPNGNSSSKDAIQIYNEYNSGKIKIDELKRIGDPVFNRCASRWTPITNISSYEDFRKSKSFPAPLGIRNKDFSLPSDLIKVFKSMIKQFACCNDIIDKDFKELGKVFPFIRKINKQEHTICTFCGECLNIYQCTSEYNSKTNYIEICHRDPNERCVESNIYWGHGDCNRKQGGQTELEYLLTALKLAKNNPKLLEHSEVKEYISILN